MTSQVSERRDRPYAAFHQAETIAEVWQAIGPLSHLDRAVRLANRCLQAVPGVRVRIAHLITGPPARRILGTEAETILLTDGGPVLVPIRSGKSVVGVLRVIVDPAHLAAEPAIVEILIALGGAFAAVIDHSILKAALADHRREIGLLRQQMETAAEALVNAGDHLTSGANGLAVGLRATTDAQRQQSILSSLHELAAAQRAQRRGAGALFLGGGIRDLTSWLRQLAASLGRAHGTDVTVRFRGEPYELADEVTQAISHLTLEWALSARIEARATSVALLLGYSDRGVSLAMRDDGVGLSHRDLFGVPGGIRSLQRLVEMAGGRFRVRNAEPRGVEVAVGFTRPAKAQIGG